MNPLIQPATRVDARTFHLLSRRFFTLASAIFLASAITTPSVANEFPTCKPVHVAVGPDRIHVECDKPISSIKYFAVSTAYTEPAQLARILSVLLAARAAGKAVVVEYNPADTSGNDFGCSETDCRRLVSVSF